MCSNTHDSVSLKGAVYLQHSAECTHTPAAEPAGVSHVIASCALQGPADRPSPLRPVVACSAACRLYTLQRTAAALQPPDCGRCGLKGRAGAGDSSRPVRDLRRWHARARSAGAVSAPLPRDRPKPATDPQLRRRRRPLHDTAFHHPAFLQPLPMTGGHSAAAMAARVSTLARRSDAPPIAAAAPGRRPRQTRPTQRSVAPHCGARLSPAGG